MNDQNPASAGGMSPAALSSQTNSGASNSPITIGVDARTFQYTDSTSRGIGHYALHHLLALAPLRPAWRFLLFNDTGTTNKATDRLLKFPNFKLHGIDADDTPSIDLFHIPDPMNMSAGFDSPFRMFPKAPGTVIFHDLIPMRFYWNTWGESTQQAYLLRLEQLRRRNVRVLTNSEFTRLDLIKGASIAAERTETIMAGLNRAENPADPNPAAFVALRKKFGITKQFFMHVGALDPHKNFEAVIQAFGRLTQRGSAQLVVVGRKEHYLKQIADFVEQQKMTDIIFTDFVSREELEALYSEAVALLFLSKYEGFGFPVLEAMAQGCPVITTNVTSIPEVAGDAALLYSPDDVTGIAMGMQKLLGSFTRREEYRRKGLARAALFTWDKCAQKTIAAWENMLSSAVLAASLEKPAATFALPIATAEEPRNIPVTIAPPGTEPKTEAAHVTEIEIVLEKEEAPAPTHDVVWFAPWQNPSGYCSEALSFVQGLPESAPLELVDVARTKSPAFVAGLPGHLKSILDVRLREKADTTGKVAIFHMPGSSIAPISGAAYCIGRTMFETDRIPASWVTRLNMMDEVWVPSQFNVETFAASGVERSKLVVLPGAVDEQEFDPARHEPLPLPDRAAFNFLSVFEWSSRKGWDVLLAAYFREFTAQDDVCLYIRTYLTNHPDGDPTPAIERLIREHAATLGLGDKALPRVRILAQQIAQADLPRLYKAVDCLVAPSRGEGWGRPHHEAMLMEIPVIATNWSGNTEFMNADNSYLLDYELVEAKQLEGELWHYHGHRWANPSEKHLRELMRRVSTQREEASAIGRAARRQMVANYSVARAAERIRWQLAAVDAQLAASQCKPVAGLKNITPEPFQAGTTGVNVALEGSFLDLGSLSHVNRELSRQLTRIPQVKLTCVGKNGLAKGAESMPIIQEMARRLQAQPSKNTEITVRHSWPPNWEAPATGAWVTIQPWEFGALPVEWVQHFANVDEAWVPSEYVRRVYVDSGVEPSKVKVVPNGIDPSVFKPGCSPMKLATPKSFKFLFVGGTIHRKGADLLLEAYLKNFTAADDVCLVIKDFGGKSVYAGQTLESQIKAAQAQPGAPEILYLNEELASEALPSLYAACDCLVHPYRGEGFGLPVLEAMACALPVILTAGGSTDDFASDEHAYRIPARHQTIGSELSGMKLVRDGWLLEPNAFDLADKMKWVVAHRDEARARGAAASEYVRREWTWERAARIAARRLVDLSAKLKADALAVEERRNRKSGTIALPATARLGGLEAARAALDKKNYTASWEAGLAALSARPFHCEAWLLLAQVAHAAGDTDQARACIDRVRKMAPDWKPAKQFARSLSTKGRPQTWAPLPDANAKPRLTVCLITKNEERFLGKCLGSVAELASQIVVLDTGSTDRTLEIANAFKADIHHYKWTDDFSAARNEALRYVTGDWILFLDADEELLPEHRQTIVKEMQAASVMAYRLPIIDIGKENEGCSYVPRLFRNAPGLFYVGRVHEQIFTSIEVRCQEWGLENRHGKSALLHHGYTKELVADRNKIARNLRLLELAIEELPNEPNLIMSFGLELVRSGQLEAGLEQYWEAFYLMSALPQRQVVPELRETLLTQLSSHLMAAKRHGEIVKLWRTSFAKSGSITASQHFILGLAQMELKEPAEAAEQMRQCVAKRNRPVFSPINAEIMKAGPNHCLALCLVSLQQEALAEQAFKAALADDPQSRPARYDFARFQADRQQPIEALKLMHELVEQQPAEFQAWQYGGQLALSKPDFLEFACDWTSEAVKHHPQNPVLALQRAEALLLSGNAAQALPFWTAAHSPKSARHLAALVLCEAVNGACERRFSPGDEGVVSQEFLRWYRSILSSGANALVNQINSRVDILRSVLPSFARVLDAAMKEAQAPAR